MKEQQEIATTIGSYQSSMSIKAIICGERKFTLLHKIIFKNIASKLNSSVVFFILFLFFSLQNKSFAQEIFSNQIIDPNPSSYNPFNSNQYTDAHLYATGIGRGSGITPVIGSDRYNAANFSSTVRDTSDYFRFIMIPDSLYQINFSSFEYVGVNSVLGPTVFSLRSSLNGFSTSIGTANATGTSISLTAINFQNIRGPIEFRLYAWGATNSSGTFGLDNFRFNGEVILAPELTSTAPTNFGNVCLNTISAIQSFLIQGYNLNEDTVRISPMNGYKYSSDSLNFFDSLSFVLLGTQNKTIYIRFQPTAVAFYNGNIMISGGGASEIFVPVSGRGIGSFPIVTVGTVSTITTSSAIVNASVTNSGCGSILTYGIEYSTTAGFANGTGNNISGNNLVGSNFSVSLTGLTPPGQTIYFHTYASNVSGIKYGTENSFTLLSNSPTLSVPSTGSGSLASFGNICINTVSVANSFKLTGSILDGSSIVIGPLSNYSFSTSLAGSFVPTLMLTQGASGYNYNSGTLTNCIIYVKFSPTTIANYSGAISISGGGAPSIEIPVTANSINTAASVNTGSALSITTNSANLLSTITSQGCGDLIEYGFEYSTNPSFTPGSGIRVISSNRSGNAFSFQLTGLTPSTVYYYCAYAINNGGTSFGLINNFLTAAVPTTLVITSITPISPLELSSFSIVVTAVDNLISMNPINVNENTVFDISQVAGSFLLSNSTTLSGTILSGTNSVTIHGFFYNHNENQIGIIATATSGMSLITSPIYYFNVLPYTGASDFIWSSDGGNKWLIGNNWQVGRPPGSVSATNNHVAYFTNLAKLDSTSSGGCGIDMRSASQDFHVGSIVFENTYNTNHFNGIVAIGNNSDQFDGVLNIDGRTVNNAGGISGNNYADLLIANYMTGDLTKTLEIRNAVGNGNQNLELNFPNSGTIAVSEGNEIDINVRLVGNQSLTLTGGGVLKLTPSGISSNNSFSGPINIANGTLIAGNTGALNNITPSDITLGSLASEIGQFNLNGKNITIGALSSLGLAGSSNKIHNGSSNATLTISTSINSIFSGSLSDGSAGQLSLIKSGTGHIEFDGTNSYSGVTTINNGVVKLNKPGGNTLGVQNSIVLNNGELDIATDQTLKNITLNGGTLRIENGVVLTITDSYFTSNFSTTTIVNNGTIRISCNSIQNFPGQTVTIGSMNNLIANNATGILLDNNLEISGVLEIASGSLTVGNHKLTIQHPITGNGLLLAGSSSSIEIAGMDSGIVLPSNIIQLKNFTVNNVEGTILQNNLFVFNQLLIENGVVNVGENITLNGTGNLVMTGGELRLSKNGVLQPELTGTYSLTGGSIGFAGSGLGSNAQKIKAVNYYNLISYSGGDRVMSTNGTIGIRNQFIPANNRYEIIGSVIDFNKIGSQQLPAFDYYQLKLSGGLGSMKFLDGKIRIHKKITLLADTRLTLGDNDVELLSDSIMTASVGYIASSNSFIYNGSGRFVVNRYIPVGLTHGKSWQFLSVPNFDNNLKDCWQEGNSPLSNNTPFLGTTISGHRLGAVSRGFDFYTPAGSSIKYYDDVTNNWFGIDDGLSTTSNISLTNVKGYLIFVRGDRSVQSYNATPSPTTLRTRGKLYSRGTDAPAAITVLPGHFQSVGNPYASAIDFNSLLITSNSIDTKFYVWDPMLPGSLGYGGYQTISSVNGYRPIPGGTSNYNADTSYTSIQSGQAFFVYATQGGNVSFSEANKINNSLMAFRQLNTTTNAAVFSAKLYNAARLLVDGNAVFSSDTYDDSFDENDASKIINISENFYVCNNQKNLALDARNTITESDTIFYKIKNLTQQQYSFHFTSKNFVTNNLQAFLKDKFLSTDFSIDINGSDYFFTITNDPSSYDENRFYLYFKSIAVLASTEFNLTGSCNRGEVSLLLNVVNETNVQEYVLQKSDDAIHYYTIHNVGTIQNTGNNVSYRFSDLLQDNISYYRVLINTIHGEELLSNTVKIIEAKNDYTFKIFPNPVVGNNIHLSLSGFEKGKNKAILLNNAGQILQEFNFEIQPGLNNKVLKINEYLPKGCYILMIGNKKLNFKIE